MAGCGGNDAAGEPDAAAVQVEASNTTEGRFPEEELVRSQEEAATAEAEAAAEAEAQAELVEEPVAPPEPVPAEPPPAEEPTEPAPEPPSAVEGSESVAGIPAGSIVSYPSRSR